MCVCGSTCACVRLCAYVCVCVRTRACVSRNFRITDPSDSNPRRNQEFLRGCLRGMRDVANSETSLYNINSVIGRLQITTVVTYVRAWRAVCADQFYSCALLDSHISFTLYSHFFVRGRPQGTTAGTNLRVCLAVHIKESWCCRVHLR